MQRYAYTVFGGFAILVLFLRSVLGVVGPRISRRKRGGPVVESLSMTNTGVLEEAVTSIDATGVDQVLEIEIAAETKWIEERVKGKNIGAEGQTSV